MTNLFIKKDEKKNEKEGENANDEELTWMQNFTITKNGEKQKRSYGDSLKGKLRTNFLNSFI